MVGKLQSCFKQICSLLVLLWIKILWIFFHVNAAMNVGGNILILAEALNVWLLDSHWQASCQDQFLYTKITDLTTVFVQLDVEVDIEELAYLCVCCCLAVLCLCNLCVFSLKRHN